ncbi:hypothetical protein [Polaribacter sp. Q13]|uniref:hypothetical protein n=1 Tax=Polaribacter sp. Q13 TaxID=2806551 RepID=UPI00193B201A|nr:hypothetical protein [Polaribacter sp. Q13]QVY65926.1 hypothetical protein JOP69_01130 [Polaribacter sp. Q13]
MNKKTYILISFFCSFFSAKSQWRHPNHTDILNDVIITYKVEYDNKLSIRQQNSPHLIKEIIVIFNKDKLIEKTIRNTFDAETFVLFDYNKEIKYDCYKSVHLKIASASNFRPLEKTLNKLDNEQEKLLNFNTNVYNLILINNKSKETFTREIITTNDIGLGFVNDFYVDGFLLKYFDEDSKLGTYTVTATQISYHKLPEETYSLKGLKIKSVRDQKKSAIKEIWNKRRTERIRRKNRKENKD